MTDGIAGGCLSADPRPSARFPEIDISHFEMRRG